VASDLIVKIGADAKQFSDEVDKIKKKTEDLTDGLEKTAKISGVVFGALAGSATAAVFAFKESEEASNKLTIALQNQGKNAKEVGDKYKAYAKEVERATGIDDDAVVAAQAKLQTLIGQQEITQELTDALVDLSTETGSLDSAAEKLGLAFQGNTTYFSKQKIAIDDNATAQERLSQAVAGVNQRLGGQAEALAGGLGALNKLKTAFGNLLETIGERLAPAVTKAANALTSFINYISDSPKLISFAIAVGEIVASLAAAVAIFATAGLAIVKISEVLNIASVALKLFGISAKTALISFAGIGLIITAIVLIVENIDYLKAFFVGAMVTISEAARGAAKIVGGAFKFNLEQVQEGFEQLKNSLSKGIEAGEIKFKESKEGQGDAGAAAVKESEDNKKRIRDEAAAAETADLARRDELKRQALAASLELQELMITQASEATIALKTQEKDLLGQIEQEKNEDLRAKLEERLEINRAYQEQQAAEDKARKDQFEGEILAKNTEYQALTEEQKAEFLQKNGAQLQAATETEATTKKKALATQAKQQVDANNQFLADQEKYGTEYAAINQAVQSDEIKGTEQGTKQLLSLQNSKNKELKAIGKAAAVVDITINTAKAALAAYAGFAAIPIIGIPLGIAAAGAVVAFGALQIGEVLSAQTGGLVPGANTGGDSIPSILQAGELVVPRNNFNEVVSAVAAQRASNGVESSSGVAGAAGNAGANGEISFRVEFSGDNAEKFLTAKQVEARSLGTLREATAS